MYKTIAQSHWTTDTVTWQTRDIYTYIHTYIHRDITVICSLCTKYRKTQPGLVKLHSPKASLGLYEGERETCCKGLKSRKVEDPTGSNLEGDQLWPVPPSLGLLHRVKVLCSLPPSCLFEVGLEAHSQLHQSDWLVCLVPLHQVRP